MAASGPTYSIPHRCSYLQVPEQPLTSLHLQHAQATCLLPPILHCHLFSCSVDTHTYWRKSIFILCSSSMEQPPCHDQRHYHHRLFQKVSLNVTFSPISWFPFLYGSLWLLSFFFCLSVSYSALYPFGEKAFYINVLVCMYVCILIGGHYTGASTCATVHTKK